MMVPGLESGNFFINMSGIYVHIPFCKRKCIYCDFYSIASSRLSDRYVKAVGMEAQLRGQEIAGMPVKTLYIGGGTPSQLKEDELDVLFHTLEAVYGLQSAEEITIEANPDDLTDRYVDRLRRFPINRISIGIQTFDDPTLKLLNRRHTARQAIEAVERCRQAGFHNLSIDLIYGLPDETDRQWENDLTQALALQPEHISAYHLTYEEGTPLFKMLQSHRIHEVDEDSSLRFFTTLMDTLAAAGYEHYEISNFCKPGMQSKHNSAYWQGIAYLGCGPSAHSYNTYSREWNEPSLKDYIHALEQGKRLFQSELLDNKTRYNEYVMTTLRTQRGASADEIDAQFGKELQQYFLTNITPYLTAGKLQRVNDRVRLTREGLFVSDGIISDLMFV